MLYIWIDESYDSPNVLDPKYLVLGSVVLNENSNSKIIDVIHSRTMYRIKEFNKANKKKIRLSNNELHENDLYKKKFSRVINWFLSELATTNNINFFVTHTNIENNKDNTFSLDTNTYCKTTLNLIILIFNKLLPNPKEPIKIYLDMLFKNETKKQNEILNYLTSNLKNYNVDISFNDSASIKGLQAADCVTGTFRRFLRNEKTKSFEIIKDKIVYLQKK